MREQDILEQAMEYVREAFREDCSGHDFFHAVRVCQMARKIAEKENADLFIVQLAALLHDVDDRKLSPETNEHKGRAAAFMKSQSMLEDTIRFLCDMIEVVAFVGRDSVVPSSLEGKELLKNKFSHLTCLKLPLLRCHHSAYLKYASFFRLA